MAKLIYSSLLLSYILFFSGCNEQNMFEPRTEPSLPPSEPVLLSPANNSTELPIDPVLRWAPSTHATFYSLQVSREPDFSILAYSATNIPADSIQVYGLRNRKRHYWRIKAHNAYYKTGYSDTYQFLTMDGIPNATPCPGLPEITYEGQIYHTVQIKKQCWLKENLNVGKMIPDTDTMKNNSIIEKYCYANDTANCSKYGGLYIFKEAVKYLKRPSKTQGICPNGWHIPTISDYAIMISYFYEFAEDLKAVGVGSGEGTGTNLSGFNALICGYINYRHLFLELGNETYLWTSDQFDDESAYGISLPGAEETAYLVRYVNTNGYSIRCIKN